MNGYPDREGVRALSPVMDISTAMMVGNAVLGALLARSAWAAASGWRCPCSTRPS